MTLENLLKTGQLEPIAPDRTAIHRLLAVAAASIADAKKTSISNETRFDAAYKAIMQCAMAALRANGYRTSRNRPGHHVVMIQSLPKTLQVEPEVMVVLDALRQRRNLADYTGAPVTDAAVSECVEQAEQLIVWTRRWLVENKPDLA